MDLEHCLEQDTIVASATPPGQGGVGIVRVSGPVALAIAKLVARCSPKPRFAQWTSFFDEADQLIDQGIVLYFQGPNSFTGEDVVEFQSHGGVIIRQRLIQSCVAAGARQARAGEFSERAFLNQKIDLIQAEAIADLIAAGSVQASQAALRSMQGEFSQRVLRLQAELTELRKWLEAGIDFSDQDIDVLEEYGVLQKLEALQHSAKKLLKDAERGQKLQHGLTVVLAGSPNVGKSTLLNKLAREEVAIVTEFAGTTRDKLKSTLSIQGLPVHLIDTAGLRESTDPIEQEGIRRTKEAIRQADLVLWVCDMALGQRSVVKEYEACMAWRQRLDILNIPTFFIGNKLDQVAEIHLSGTPVQMVEPSHLETAEDLIKQWLPEPAALIHYLQMAAAHDYGISELEHKIWQLAGLQQVESTGTLSARTRHLQALSQMLECIDRAHTQYLQKTGIEFIAEELRLAQLQLSELTGESTSDDLLGTIFSSFCIGK